MIGGGAGGSTSWPSIARSSSRCRASATTPRCSTGPPSRSRRGQAPEVGRWVRRGRGVGPRRLAPPSQGGRAGGEGVAAPGATRDRRVAVSGSGVSSAVAGSEGEGDDAPARRRRGTGSGPARRPGGGHASRRCPRPRRPTLVAGRRAPMATPVPPPGRPSGPPRSRSGAVAAARRRPPTPTSPVSTVSPTPGTDQSHTPVGNTAWSRAHWVVGHRRRVVRPLGRLQLALDDVVGDRPAGRPPRRRARVSPNTTSQPGTSIRAGWAAGSASRSVADVGTTHVSCAPGARPAATTAAPVVAGPVPGVDGVGPRLGDGHGRAGQRHAVPDHLAGPEPPLRSRASKMYGRTWSWKPSTGTRSTYSRRSMIGVSSGAPARSRRRSRYSSSARSAGHRHPLGLPAARRCRSRRPARSRARSPRR